MKIMIVDDSAAMRMIVKKTLRQAGFEGHEITEAEDGAKALAAIQSASPDLVLSDWNMPNMTGIELLEKLAASGAKLKFGFVTTEATADMRARATPRTSLKSTKNCWHSRRRASPSAFIGRMPLPELMK